MRKNIETRFNEMVRGTDPQSRKGKAKESRRIVTSGLQRIIDDQWRSTWYPAKLRTWMNNRLKPSGKWAKDALFCIAHGMEGGGNAFVYESPFFLTSWDAHTLEEKYQYVQLIRLACDYLKEIVQDDKHIEYFVDTMKDDAKKWPSDIKKMFRDFTYGQLGKQWFRTTTPKCRESIYGIFA